MSTRAFQIQGSSMSYGWKTEELSGESEAFGYCWSVKGKEVRKRCDISKDAQGEPYPRGGWGLRRGWQAGQLWTDFHF